jgi:hypothetical protein
LSIRTALGVLLLLALTVLLSGQPAYAHVGPTLYAGHYNLSLKSQAKIDSQGKLINNLIAILPKTMTLDISRGSKIVTFRFQWTHIPLGADPSHYVFIMGFDLNNNGVWEDLDNNPYTLDDTLVLYYWGWNLVTPPPCWICLNFVQGLHVISWSNSSNGFQEIYTPGGTNVPGPLYPNLDPVVFGSSMTVNKKGMAYSYTLTLTAPLGLFPRSNPITGFGLSLLQETGVVNSMTRIPITTTTTNLVWVWPPQTLPENPSLTDPNGAALLGDLNLWGKPRR